MLGGGAGPWRGLGSSCKYVCSSGGIVDVAVI